MRCGLGLGAGIERALELRLVVVGQGVHPQRRARHDPVQRDAGHLLRDALVDRDVLAAGTRRTTGSSATTGSPGRRPSRTPTTADRRRHSPPVPAQPARLRFGGARPAPRLRRRPPTGRSPGVDRGPDRARRARGGRIGGDRRRSASGPPGALVVGVDVPSCVLTGPRRRDRSATEPGFGGQATGHGRPTGRPPPRCRRRRARRRRGTAAPAGRPGCAGHRRRPRRPVRPGRTPVVVVVGDLDHVGDHGGHVVRGAGGQGEVDQLGDGGRRIGDLGQHPGDRASVTTPHRPSLHSR